MRPADVTLYLHAHDAQNPQVRQLIAGSKPSVMDKCEDIIVIEYQDVDDPALDIERGLQKMKIVFDKSWGPTNRTAPRQMELSI